MQPGGPHLPESLFIPLISGWEPLGTAKSGDAQPASPLTPAPRFMWCELRRNIRGGARTSSGAGSPRNRAPHESCLRFSSPGERRVCWAR